jgi:hypothetical protein
MKARCALIEASELTESNGKYDGFDVTEHRRKVKRLKDLTVFFEFELEPR